MRGKKLVAKVNAQVAGTDRSLKIWVLETMPENCEDVYSNYYLGRYQFDMRKFLGAWLANSVRNTAAPKETSTIEQIGQMIDAKINTPYTK